MAGYEYAYGHTPDGYVQAGLRLGVGVGVPVQEDRQLVWLVPLTHHVSIGPGAHRFEASLGVAYVYATEYLSLLLPVLPIIQAGYRYQAPGKRWVGRVHVGSIGVGASVGWAF